MQRAISVLFAFYDAFRYDIMYMFFIYDVFEKEMTTLYMSRNDIVEKIFSIKRNRMEYRIQYDNFWSKIRNQANAQKGFQENCK